MKKKAINKKLFLNKENVANLTNTKMNKIIGGVAPSEYPACAHTHDENNGRCVVLKVPMPSSFQEC
jgi:hypothetical protein